LDDIDESLDCTNSLGRNTGDVSILCMQPLSRLFVVTTDERVEAAVQAKEEQRELAFFALRLESAPMLQA